MGGFKGIGDREAMWGWAPSSWNLEIVKWRNALWSKNMELGFSLLGSTRKTTLVWFVFLSTVPKLPISSSKKHQEQRESALLGSFLGDFRWSICWKISLGSLALFKCFHSLIFPKCTKYRKMPLLRNSKSVYVFSCPTFRLETFYSESDQERGSIQNVLISFTFN